MVFQFCMVHVILYLIFQINFLLENMATILTKNSLLVEDLYLQSAAVQLGSCTHVHSAMENNHYHAIVLQHTAMLVFMGECTRVQPVVLQHNCIVKIYFLIHTRLALLVVPFPVIFIVFVCSFQLSFPIFPI